MIPLDIFKKEIKVGNLLLYYTNQSSILSSNLGIVLAITEEENYNGKILKLSVGKAVEYKKFMTFKKVSIERYERVVIIPPENIQNYRGDFSERHKEFLYEKWQEVNEKIN